jgi:xanthine dehydrogenase accessory factor
MHQSSDPSMIRSVFAGLNAAQNDFNIGIPVHRTMKELAAILQTRTRNDANDAVLATIVKASGSSYRRAGAHMLILPNGEVVGSISGGCLEQDVIANAAKVRKSGTPLLLSYDTTKEEDVLFGVGLGCNGVIEVWLEPLNDATPMLDFCENLFENGETGVVATTFRGPNAGSRAFLDDTSKYAASTTESDEAGNETFFEVLQPPVQLFIFGAGYDAIPLASFANQLGYRVCVVDRRPAYAARERFPDADEVCVKAASEIPAFAITKRTAAIVMSHHYVSDRDYLNALLPLPLTYLGLMGPRRRAEKMLQELREAGTLVGDEHLQKLHNPIGLDIGAEGPEEIALSILSEIRAVFAGHSGGLLREKKGPIHSPRRDLL